MKEFWHCVYVQMFSFQNMNQNIFDIVLPLAFAEEPASLLLYFADSHTSLDEEAEADLLLFFGQTCTPLPIQTIDIEPTLVDYHTSLMEFAEITLCQPSNILLTMSQPPPDVDPVHAELLLHLFNFDERPGEDPQSPEVLNRHREGKPGGISNH